MATSDVSAKYQLNMQSACLLSKNHLALLRFSVVFVWLSTAVVSIWELNGQSYQLLTSAGIEDPILVKSLIWGGAIVDAALGVAMWLRPSKPSYMLALIVMLVMTVVATLINANLWLHPLGPLTKNIPIAAALWTLYKSHK
jgi:hypothetical protein